MDGKAQLLPPSESHPYPSIRVSLDRAGVYTVFARQGRAAIQRLQCLAFMPEKIIPIQFEKLNVHVRVRGAAMWLEEEHSSA